MSRGIKNIKYIWWKKKIVIHDLFDYVNIEWFWLGTKNTSESKPSATAALGARKSTWFTWWKTEKNVRTAPVVWAKIRPDQKWEKTTARGLPWGPKTHRNQSQAQLQLSEPENPPGSPGEKLKKT